VAIAAAQFEGLAGLAAGLALGHVGAALLVGALASAFAALVRGEAVALAVANEQHLMNEVPDGLRRELASSFRRLMKRGADAAVFDALAGQIERLLSIRPATVESRTE